MRQDVELLRIFAAFGIVWFHSGYPIGRDIAYSGLVIFLILSSYFAISSTKHHTLSERLARLALPFIFWTLLYGIINLMTGKEFFPYANNLNLIPAVLSSSSIHLWYLPFILICILLIDLTKNKIRTEYFAIISTISFSILLATSPIWREYDYTKPIGQYLHALPSIFIGVYLGTHKQLGNNVRNLLLTIISITTIYIAYRQVPGISSTYLIGILASGILLTHKSIITGHKIIPTISKLTFGIYLAHVLVIFVLRHLGISGIMLPIFSFMISLTGVFIAFRLIPPKICKYIL